ncbi:MAG: TatD family hydrolase [Bacteroidaceae bacterium]|nr:TatD family hydrolase [Bacteroidaceae bacterium]
MPEDDNEIAIVNSYPGKSCFIENAYLSCGIHPWHVNDTWKEQFENLPFEAKKNSVLAIGECGLDKLFVGNFRQQIEAFRAQVTLSETLQKPMIIHCVKAFDELLAIHKEISPSQKWLIHGFRGKPEQAKQLMAKGLLLSFGHRYNVETLLYVASTYRCLYLETDDSSLSIRQIYHQVACHLSSGNLG